MIHSQQAARNSYRHNQYSARSEELSPEKRLLLLLRGLDEILCRCEGCMGTGQPSLRGELIGQGMDIFIALKQGLAAPADDTHQARQVLAITGQLHQLYDNCLLLLSRTTLENNLETLKAVRHVVRELETAWQPSKMGSQTKLLQDEG